MADKSISPDGVRSAILGRFIVLETLRKAAWIKQGEWVLERDGCLRGDNGTGADTARILQDAIEHLRGLRLEWGRQNREAQGLIADMFLPDTAQAWQLWSPYQGDDLFDPNKAVRMAAYTEEVRQL